jgi:hypothetical protein
LSLFPDIEDIPMLIHVVYNNEKLGTVLPGGLQRLITTNDIIAFRRSNGWVIVGEDPIRTYEDETKYKGPEKRKPFMTLKFLEEIVSDK